LSSIQPLLIWDKKDKVFPVHAIKAYKGIGGMVPHILSLGIRWGWVGNITSWLLYCQKGTL